MGACESIIESKNKGSANECEKNHRYKSDYYVTTLYDNKLVNLQFIFSHIKIKYCISHSKTGNSTFITEISIGQKNFRLMVNQGKNPVIEPKNIFEITNSLKLKDLLNIYLSISIYEFIDEININIFNQMNILPEQYKAKSQYKSYFKKNLFSFLFNSKKCEFSMEGQNQLSSNCRISFICEIRNKEKIKITANCKNNKKISKLIFKEKNENIIAVATGTFSDEFTLETPPITIKELIQSELYLETNENDIDYEYISLNDLKFSIMKELGQNILKQLPPYIIQTLNNPFSDNSNLLNQTNSTTYLSNSIGDATYYSYSGLNGIEKNKFEKEKDNIYLIIENLPLVFQISSLYLTEFGNLYNTSVLNIINDDIAINNYRKSSSISWEEFYIKLNKIYSLIKKGSFDYNNVLNELNNILRRSIDEEKFYFLYPNIESLIKMNILIINIGIKLILYTKNITDENMLNLFLKSINYILKREELENGVLLYCLTKGQNSENLKIIYNEFFYTILKLNDYCKKNFPSSTNILIDIYSRLYFKNKYIREAILNTFNQEIINDKYQSDIFIYDRINDDPLNKYLEQKSINLINQINKSKYFSNLFSGGIYFFRNIIYHLNEMNINDFPYDFTNFIDNQNMLNLLANYVKHKKIENLDDQYFEICFILSGSFDAINTINNRLIKSTNGYNNIAVYKLFEYYKYLLEYYYTKENCKLIMNYSDFEKAMVILIGIDSSVALNKLFWFYYSCSHLIIGEHLKYFIINICNKNFNRFAFHWSFSVREIFFKLLIFIFNDRLKDKEGSLIKIKKFPDYAKNKVDNKVTYKEESLKDYELINNEYKEWKQIAANPNGTQNSQIEYPPIFLPSPVNPDNIDMK